MTGMAFKTVLLLVSLGYCCYIFCGIKVLSVTAHWVLLKLGFTTEPKAKIIPGADTGILLSIDDKNSS